MVQRIRGRLTYANVVASAALFIALGGVSYAAVALPKDSVGPTQIKRQAVTGSKVKDSSLTGADVRDRSLTAADFSGSVQGPAGPKGDTGPKGSPGLRGDQGPKGDPGGMLDVAPSGFTMVGVYDVLFTATAPDQFGSDSVTFPVPLSSPPDVHFVARDATPPEECATATRDEPLPGNLCVYASTPAAVATFYGITDPVESVTPAAAAIGFSITFSSPAAGGTASRGYWLVTAP